MNAISTTFTREASVLQLSRVGEGGRIISINKRRSSRRFNGKARTADAFSGTLLVADAVLSNDSSVSCTRNRHAGGIYMQPCGGLMTMVVSRAEARRRFTDRTKNFPRKNKSLKEMRIVKSQI